MCVFVCGGVCVCCNAHTHLILMIINIKLLATRVKSFVAGFS